MESARFTRMNDTTAQTDKLYLAPGHLGCGVRARTSIAKGEVCGYLSGKLIRFQESTSTEGSNSVQVGPDLYVLPKFPMLYMNHSCNPNAGLSHDLSLVAIRDIHLDEEIVIDYSTTMFEKHFTMDCLCKEPVCRQVIEDFDLLPEALQQHYIDLGIVQSFISEQYDARNNHAASGLVKAINAELGIESKYRKKFSFLNRETTPAGDVHIRSQIDSPVNPLR